MADMEMIRSIGASICITIIVTGIFSILVPGKNMERTIQLAVGLFFLASIVQPIVNGDWRELLEWDSRQIETQIPELEDTVDNRVVTLTEEGLQRQVAALLQGKGISAKQVGATVHIEEDNSITITEILIILPREEILNAPAAEQLVEENLGVVPELELERNG